MQLIPYNRICWLSPKIMVTATPHLHYSLQLRSLADDYHCSSAGHLQQSAHFSSACSGSEKAPNRWPAFMAAISASNAFRRRQVLNSRAWRAA